MKTRRAYTDISSIDADLVESFKLLRERFDFPDGGDVEYALCGIETFCAVALKLMRRSNPSKVRDCAMTIEIRARMDGIPVIREAA